MPDAEVDALYGLPLEEFTSARNALAGQLRSRGQDKAADQVGDLSKPTVAAWAVNQVMRTQRKDARALLTAGERLRKAHAKAAAGDAGAGTLREAADAERAAVGRLTQAARGLTNSSGRGLSETILERVTQTLHAISADNETRTLAQAARATSDAERGLARARRDMRLADKKVADKEAEVAELRSEIERLRRRA